MSEAVRTLTLQEIAEVVGGTVEGDASLPILGATNLTDALPGTIARVEHSRFLAAAEESAAAALLLPPSLGPVTKPCIRVENPRMAFIRCLELFDREEQPPAGIHPTAVIGEGAEIDPTAHVGAYATLGAGVRVAEGAVIHPHVVVGDRCEIGPRSVLFPQVVLYPRTVLGARVRIHASAVIGADGYGYEWSGKHHQKKPHNGRVRIEDDVEIGAHTAVDRATTGETVIGAGTKIDNLVQVAHNVRTGAHCLIVSQVGIAGSAVLGNGVVIGGQAGVNPHVKVGDGSQVGGQSGVWSTIPAGSKVSGNPARAHREEVRIQASLAQLPELLRRVKALERQLAAVTGDEAADGGE
ncbi:MAG: UDP-3-O-(3-hydroxymyristoyl)glucosamine N-acyltransferase [Armatimonadota bacterium]